MYTQQKGDLYELLAQAETARWQNQLNKETGGLRKYSDKLQRKINEAIPQKVHDVITRAMKGIIEGVLSGSDLIGTSILEEAELEERENRVAQRTAFYSTTAALEGFVTGATGIVGGIADFPLFLGFKMRFLSEVAACYGFDTARHKAERVFMLHVFQLCFSKQAHRRQALQIIIKWDSKKHESETDWLVLQQEYRDYIDIAKLLQLLPVVGAPVGLFVNRKLVKQLGQFAKHAYRIRLLRTQKNLQPL